MPDRAPPHWWEPTTPPHPDAPPFGEPAHPDGPATVKPRIGRHPDNPLGIAITWLQHIINQLTAPDPPTENPETSDIDPLADRPRRRTQ